MKRALVVLLLLAAFTRGAAQAQPCSDPTPEVLTDGYCLQGFAIPGLITMDTYYAVPPTNFVTRALYENPTVAETTAALSHFDIHRVEGLIVLNSPSTAGWIVSIRVPVQYGRPQASRWYTVMDVSAAMREHLWFHGEDENSGIELSYPLAVAFEDINYTNEHGDRYLQVQVCLSETPDTVCADPPVDYRRWLERIVTWEPPHVGS